MAQQYTVKGGDTLSGIAAKYGVKISDISGYRSGNPSLIYPNEVLNIGGGASNPTNSPPKFQNTDSVQNYLNTRQNNFYQDNSNSSFGLPELDFNLADSVKNIQGLLPTTKAPTAPDLLGTYQGLRSEYGLDGLEKEIADLTALEGDITAQYRINRDAETGKPVAQGVIEGRISEQAKAANEDLDFIGRQKARKVDELKSRYGVIDTIMNLTQKDFENAKAIYNDEFDKAYKSISLAQGERDFQFDVVKNQQTIARANAQIMVNAIKDGNLSVSDMPADQQAQLNKLELQSGLPMGFFSNLKMDAGANVVSTSSYQGQTQVLMRNSDGSLSLQTYGVRDGGGGSNSLKQGSENFVVAKGEMRQTLDNVTGLDGYVSPDSFRKAARDWSSTGFDIEDFYNEFRTYVNPSHYTDYGIPDKYVSGAGGLIF